MRTAAIRIEDTVFRRLANRFPQGLVAALTGMRSPRVEALPTRLSLVRSVEADFAVKVLWPPPRHVLHVEHWSWRGRLARTALYHVWYHDATGWPVRTLIVTTHRRLARAVPRVYRFRAGPGPPTQVPLSALHLWKMRAADVLARRDVALYPFVPLMQDPRAPEVLLRALEGRIIQDAETERDRGTLLAGAAFVAMRRFPEKLVLAVFGGEEKMAKLDLIQRLVKRGRKQAIEKGIEKGRQKGRQEGLVEAQRAAVLDALEARFGAPPAALRERIVAISEPARLTEILRKAVTAPGLAAFQREL